MNRSEQALAAYLKEIKDRTLGFIELRIGESDRAAVDVYLDASYSLFAPKCIFDDCDEDRAKLFLESFLANKLSVGWEVSVQLSKLLSQRGQLISKTFDPLLTTLNWESISTHLLFLSYLAVREDGVTLALKLLDKVPEDGRDGLFLACHKLQSAELDKKLMKKFVDWEAEGWSPSSTGELYALEQFIARWLGLYPYQDLEDVIRIYFIHRRDV